MDTKITALDEAADRAIDKARKLGGHDLVVWLPDEHAWGVPSATDPTKLTRVRRKKAENLPVVQKMGDNGKPVRRGKWFFFFECDCLAGQQYLVCWHRAAVYLWCKQYHNFDPDTHPLDTQRAFEYVPNNPVPGPEAVATIMQVAGPSTDDLSDTMSMASQERYLDQKYGDGTFVAYCTKIADEGPAEAAAWLEWLAKQAHP